MAYSGDPSSSPTDAVRFFAQDVGDPSLLSDEEISYLIAFSNLDPATQPQAIAAIIAEAIAAKYAGEVSINADGVNYSGDQLAQKYLQLAQTLRKAAKRHDSRTAFPFVGGVKIGEHPPAGIREPDFGVGMDDNPEGGRQNYGWNGEPGAHEVPGQVGW